MRASGRAGAWRAREQRRLQAGRGGGVELLDDVGKEQDRPGRLADRVRAHDKGTWVREAALAYAAKRRAAETKAAA